MKIKTVSPLENKRVSAGGALYLFADWNKLYKNTKTLSPQFVKGITIGNKFRSYICD